jgi:hypothetical protein
LEPPRVGGIPWSYPPIRESRDEQRDVGFLIDSFNDHFHDRLKMLLLSNRKSTVFEEVDINNILSPEFVILYEFS